MAPFLRHYPDEKCRVRFFSAASLVNNISTQVTTSLTSSEGVASPRTQRRGTIIECTHNAGLVLASDATRTVNMGMVEVVTKEIECAKLHMCIIVTGPDRAQLKLDIIT